MQEAIDTIIRRALEEDMPKGDVTTDPLFENQKSKAKLIARADGVLAGTEVGGRVFTLLDSSLTYKTLMNDGDFVKNGDTIATVAGDTASILKAERTALNLMQRMSGISTATKGYQDLISHTDCKILDTRKTAPNLRILDKQAVRTGGGENHRFSLSDMVLIKDNHINAAGDLTSAVETLREKHGEHMPIEVEVETLAQFEEALKTSADRILLDNMSTDMMRECVRLNNKKKELEASGDMTLDRVKSVAESGVDFISVGALTHSVLAFNISLRFLKEEDDR